MLQRLSDSITAKVTPNSGLNWKKLLRLRRERLANCSEITSMKGLTAMVRSPAQEWSDAKEVAPTKRPMGSGRADFRSQLP